MAMRPLATVGLPRCMSTTASFAVEANVELSVDMQETTSATLNSSIGQSPISRVSVGTNDSPSSLWRPAQTPSSPKAMMQRTEIQAA